MRLDRKTLAVLASARRGRFQGGRPHLCLSPEEIEESTRTAMRLADASRGQVEARGGGADITPG
jgi:hypothetical protein